MSQHIHFIAIGGSTMHNLAISLKRQGYLVTGSDDEIFNPAKGHLAQYDLLPEQMGWFPEKIHTGIDTIILGMHARSDNPELKRALELGLKVYSYPEYVYERCIDKQRVVIAGSHGKTTITAMVIHVLQFHKRKFDYLIGANVEGFEVMVKLTDEAPLIIIEGDEYLASPQNRQPKFLFYRHHIGLISGIAWDHINVFPTFEDYVRAFENFAENTPKSGSLIYGEDDDLVSVIGKKERPDVQAIGYDAHPHIIKNGKTFLKTADGEISVLVFGEHNMKNLNGAKAVLSKIGIEDKEFYEAIQSFKGATRRLERISENNQSAIFRDFAHAPSKLSATIQAVKNQFPERGLVACLELYTFSSLNKQFISQYKNTFNQPEIAVIYFNPKTAENKKLEVPAESDIRQAFNRPDLKVFTDCDALQHFLYENDWQNKNLLMMSSGNFDNLDFQQLSKEIIK
jgi:UDP-N-acetylmuramate: L-alanyl-gamma-D-glutamyl-meso-diaminopimelate ligase